MAVTALMGGSFNPVHIGHMMVAQYVAQWCADVEKVLMVLSPQNPLKAAGGTPDAARMEMLRIAAGASDGLIEACDIELSMPRPSYTIDTLDRLSRENPGREYRLIIGSDNWNSFSRWRAADEIIRRFGLIVYPRPGYDPVPVPPEYAGQVTVIDAPVADISSTWIRESIASGRKVNFFLPPGVSDYIRRHGLYKAAGGNDKP